MYIQKLRKVLQLIGEALEQISSGDLDKAVSTLRRAENHDPSFYLVHSLSGEIQSLRKDEKNAYISYTIAQKIADSLGIEFNLSAAQAGELFLADIGYEEYGKLLKRENLPDNLRQIAQSKIDAYVKSSLENAERILGAAATWFNMHMKPIRELGFEPAGKDVLDIGGSVIPTNCLLYLCCGARVKTIDKFRSPQSIGILGPKSQMMCYEYILDKMHDGRVCGELAGCLARMTPEEVVRIENMSVVFATPNLEFHYGVDSAHTPFDDCSFDLITSSVTLEHVGDPDGDPMDTVREIARLLRPGGLTAHLIGVNDHREPDEKPYDFLRFSEEEWKNFQCPHNQRANRWRMSRWRDAFRAAGLDEIMLSRNLLKTYPPPTDELIDSFHPDFRYLDREDLETLDFFILLRKPF